MTRLRTASRTAGIRRRSPSAVVCVALIAIVTLSTADAQQHFAQLLMPSGVATDLAGNVFVITLGLAYVDSSAP